MADASGDPDRLSATAREILDAAVGSAGLEGVTIPDSDRRLAAAFLAGEIDAAEYRAEALTLALEELDLEA